MFDLTKPVSFEIMIGGIVFVLVIISIGLLITRHYKKKEDLYK